MSQPLVSIVMGSDSDLEIMREAGKALDEFRSAYEMDVTSAHRSPDRTADYHRGRGRRGTPGGSGLSAPHLARHPRPDTSHFPAGHGFAAGNSADAGRH